MMSVAEMEWEEQSSAQTGTQTAGQDRPAEADGCAAPSVFQSFWLGGFESACQRNTRNERIDMLAATQHDVMVEEDYGRLRSVGISACRDGIRWPLIEKTPGHYDFSSFLPMLRAAARNDMQVIWALLHYGWPDDIDVLSPKFPDRFARFCRAVARVIASETDRPPFFVPVNEISFLSWAIGHQGIIHPTHIGRAHEVKKALVRTAIAGMEAVWDVDSRARFCHVDPLIYVIPPRGRPDLAAQAREQHDGQWESWDMLTGRVCPELGGDPRYLDIVGVNYYHSNQWETPDVRLHWDDPPDARRIPLHWMLGWVWERYRRPFFIAETSHFGVGRANWIAEIAQEVQTARLKHIPVEGICIYPVIDRPDWENYDHWHNSGLWDMRETAGGRLMRVLSEDYGESLARARDLLAGVGCV